MGDINEKDLPGNSFKSKKDREEKKIEKVVTGQIVERRKPFIDRFTQLFFGGDARSVLEYVVVDVLIPAAKNTIWDMAMGGLEVLLYGESRGRFFRKDRGGGKTYVSYGSYYKSQDQNDRNHREIFKTQELYRFDDIVIQDREEATEVLSNLIELIDNYDVASVADFYQMVGKDTEFTDNDYGWTSLNSARIARVREGYILVLPKPRAIQ